MSDSFVSSSNQDISSLESFSPEFLIRKIQHNIPRSFNYAQGEEPSGPSAPRGSLVQDLLKLNPHISLQINFISDSLPIPQYSLYLSDLINLLSNAQVVYNETSRANIEETLLQLTSNIPSVTAGPQVQYPSGYLSKILLDNFETLHEFIHTYFNLSLTSQLTKFLVEIIYKLNFWEVYHLVTSLPTLPRFLRILDFTVVETPFGFLIKPPKNLLVAAMYQGFSYPFPYPFYNYSFHPFDKDSTRKKYARIHIKPYIDITLNQNKRKPENSPDSPNKKLKSDDSPKKSESPASEKDEDVNPSDEKPADEPEKLKVKHEDAKAASTPKKAAVAPVKGKPGRPRGRPKGVKSKAIQAMAAASSPKLRNSTVASNAVKDSPVAESTSSKRSARAAADAKPAKTSPIASPAETFSASVKSNEPPIGKPEEAEDTKDASQESNASPKEAEAEVKDKTKESKLRDLKTKIKQTKPRKQDAKKEKSTNESEDLKVPDAKQTATEKKVKETESHEESTPTSEPKKKKSASISPITDKASLISANEISIGSEVAPVEFQKSTKPEQIDSVQLPAAKPEEESKQVETKSETSTAEEPKSHSIEFHLEKEKKPKKSPIIELSSSPEPANFGDDEVEPDNVKDVQSSDSIEKEVAPKKADKKSGQHSPKFDESEKVKLSKGKERSADVSFGSFSMDTPDLESSVEPIREANEVSPTARIANPSSMRTMVIRHSEGEGDRESESRTQTDQQSNDNDSANLFDNWDVSRSGEDMPNEMLDEEDDDSISGSNIDDGALSEMSLEDDDKRKASLNKSSVIHQCHLIDPSSLAPCLKIFYGKNELLRHQEFVHATKKKIYKCIYCSRNGSKVQSYPRHDSLARHIRRKHGITGKENKMAVNYAKENVEIIEDSSKVRPAAKDSKPLPHPQFLNSDFTIKSSYAGFLSFSTRDVPRQKDEEEELDSKFVGIEFTQNEGEEIKAHRLEGGAMALKANSRPPIPSTNSIRPPPDAIDNNVIQLSTEGFPIDVPRPKLPKGRKRDVDVEIDFAREGDEPPRHASESERKLALQIQREDEAERYLEQQKLKEKQELERQKDAQKAIEKLSSSGKYDSHEKEKDHKKHSDKQKSKLNEAPQDVETVDEILREPSFKLASPEQAALSPSISKDNVQGTGVQPAPSQVSQPVYPQVPSSAKNKRPSNSSPRLPAHSPPLEKQRHHKQKQQDLKQKQLELQQLREKEIADAIKLGLIGNEYTVPDEASKKKGHSASSHSSISPPAFPATIDPQFMAGYDHSSKSARSSENPTPNQGTPSHTPQLTPQQQHVKLTKPGPSTHKSKKQGSKDKKAPDADKKAPPLLTKAERSLAKQAARQVAAQQAAAQNAAVQQAVYSFNFQPAITNYQPGQGQGFYVRGPTNNMAPAMNSSPFVAYQGPYVGSSQYRNTSPQFQFANMPPPQVYQSPMMTYQYYDKKKDKDPKMYMSPKQNNADEPQ